MKTTCLYFLAVLLVTPISQASVITTTSAKTRLSEWTLSDHNLELKLIQRLPDQTRSFFEAREFPKTITNDIANSCVFQTITRNNSKNKSQTLHVSLKKWLIKINHKKQPIKLKEDWDKQWQNSNIKMASKIAFRWATFPTEQSFAPNGDYNWGMISFGPPPGTVFDLYIEWKVNNEPHSIWIKNMRCPQNSQSEQVTQ